MKTTLETWIRTVFLLISLINQLLTIFGCNPLPFSNEEIYQGISAFATVISSLWAWWKNNSFTTEALKADQYLANLKKGEAE